MTDAIFSGKILSDTTAGPYKAVTVEVGGRAHYCGKAEFIMEQDDLLANGFLLR